MDMNKNREVNAKYREPRAPPADYNSSDDDVSPPPSPPKYNKALGFPRQSELGYNHYVRQSKEDEEDEAFERAIHPRMFRGIVFWCCLVLIGVVVVSGAIVAVLLASKNKNKSRDSGPVVFPPPPPAAPMAPPAGAPLNYTGALAMALRFYAAQKSGKLPANNPISWREDSAIFDGRTKGWDLEGGYYDAGDHMKFVFPMAFSMTMLAWSLVEYPNQFTKSKATADALDALKWGTDWLMKAWDNDKKYMIAQVGNTTADHECWERAEDMSGDRPIYHVTGAVVGTDLVAEVSAAMAAASIVYKTLDERYSAQLLNVAYQTWVFCYNENKADTYRTFTASIPETGVQYQSSNYTDELLWGASWLYRATNNTQFLSYATAYVFQEDWTEREVSILSWDQKMLAARINMLLATEKGRLQGASKNGIAAYRTLVEVSMCRFLFDNPYSYNETWRTNGQLLYMDNWGPTQYASGAAYLAHLYGDLLNRTNTAMSCGTAKMFTSTDLRVFARYQIDYMLGKNPSKLSYMVGWTDKYPQQVHHSGASIPATGALSTCGPTGDLWLNVNQSNPNIIFGALVGGPDKNDKFNDSRPNYQQTEPSLSTQSPFVAALAAVGSLYP